MASTAIISSLLDMVSSSSATQALQKEAQWQKDIGMSWLSTSNRRDEELGDAPKMEVPKSVDDYINLARKQSRSEMPGSTEMRQDIAETQASTLSSASQAGQGADAMAAILSSGQNRMKALSQMGIAAAQYSSGKQDQYAQAVGQRAPWEQQQFEYNQWVPWQQKKNEITSMRNLGMSMIAGGGDMSAAAAISGSNSLNQGLWSLSNNPNITSAFQGSGQQGGQQITGGMNPNWNPGTQTQPLTTQPQQNYNPQTGKFEY